MAEEVKNYTQVGRSDTTITKDYTKVGKPNKDLTKDYTRIPVIGPDVMKLMSDTTSFLEDRGYSNDTIQALVTPVGQLSGIGGLDTLYKELKPTFERNVKGVEEALKMGQVMNEEFGVQPSFKETEALMTLMQRFSSESLDNVSEGHKWWIGAKRKAGDVAADKFSGVMVNVGLGMALLDSIDALDKEGSSSIPLIKHIPILRSALPGKLDILRAEIPGTKVIPKDELHDIENRVMPNLVLDNRGTKLEFDTSTSAALWVLGQRLYAFGEKTIGNVGGLAQAAGVGAVSPAALSRVLLDRWNGTEPVEDVFAAMRESGREREQTAVGVIPPLVASLGTPSTRFGSGITWVEIAERKLGLEDEFDAMYKWLADPGALHSVTAGMFWGANGAIDAIMTPSALLGGVLYKTPAALKTVTKALPGGQAKIAKLAVERAHSTRRLDDVFEAMGEAQRHLDDVDAKFRANVQANLRATGESKVSAPIWREWMLARRQLNHIKQLDDLMKDPTPAEILLQAPRRHPKMLMAPADDASVASKEIHPHRKQWLETGPSMSPRWDKADLPSFQQRKVMGPDDVEQAGVGFEAMHKTGGEAVDDIMITNSMPEYNVTPAQGPIDWLDWKNVPAIKARGKAEQRFIDSISGKALPEVPGQPKFDPTRSTLRMLLQDEDIIRRNLGTARQLKQTESIVIHTKNLEDIRKVIDKMKVKDLSKESRVYDDIFFPADNPTIMSSAERFNRWMNVAGDRVLRSLYPGSLQINFYNSSMGQMHALSRHDPVRYYEAMSPETWDVVRINMLRESQANMAWVSKVRDVFEKSGVVKKVKNFDIKKMTHDYEVDDLNSKLLYDYLNTKPTDPEFAALRQVMPKEMTEAHDALREMLEAAKDIQGVRGDEYLEGYIHHMLPKELFDQGARPLAGMGLPKDVELLASHLFKRKGNAGYKRDAVAAMELYGRFMNRRMYREPAINAILKTGDDLYSSTGNAAHRYFASMFARQLEGKPGFLGEMLDAFVGSTVKSFNRPAAAAASGALGGAVGGVAGGMVGLPGEGAAIGAAIGAVKGGRSWAPNQVGRTLMGVTSLTYMSMLGGNPRYALMQLASAVPTTASRFGLFRTLGGLMKMGTREGQALAKESGVYQSMIDILEEPTFRRLSQFIFEKWPAITPFGPMTNAKAELTARGMTMYASIGLHLNKAGFATIDDAVKNGQFRSIMFQALKDSEQANHMYGALGRNPVISRSLGQGFSTAATQFLSFMPKQTDELLSQALREPGMIARYLILSGWASKIGAQELGIDITDYNGLGYLPKEGADISSPGMDLLINLVKYANAHNSYDPAQVDLAARNLLDSAANAIPAKIQITSAMKAVNRLKTGKITTSEGELLMPMDFAGQDRIGMLLGSGGAIDAPGPGPQIFPTLLQQRDVKETLVRRGLRFSKKNDTRFLFAMQTALTDFANAVESGDEEGASRLGKALEDTYKLPPFTGNTAIERASEARYINEVIRYWSPKFGGDRKLLAQRLEMLRRYGINLSGERISGEGQGLPDEEFQRLLEGEQ